MGRTYLEEHHAEIITIEGKLPPKSKIDRVLKALSILLLGGYICY